MKTVIIRAEFYGYKNNPQNTFYLDGEVISFYRFWELFNSEEKYVKTDSYYIYEAKVYL